MPSVGPSFSPSSKPSAHVSVAASVGPLVAHDFAQFLYLFRAAYACCLQETTAPAPGERPQTFKRRFASKFNQRTPPSLVASLFDTDLAEDELEIIALSKQSPLEMSIAGVLPYIIGAVILSGGKVKLGQLKIELPSLGSGIKNLRTPFTFPRRNPGNGSQSNAFAAPIDAPIVER